MSPADFIIGYVDNDDVIVNSYYSTIRFISTEDIVNDLIELYDISGETVDGITSIEFTRSINGGNINVIFK